MNQLVKDVEEAAHNAAHEALDTLRTDVMQLLNAKFEEADDEYRLSPSDSVDEAKGEYARDLIADLRADIAAVLQ